MSIVRNWYKILGVLIILYTLIAGMIVPLKPGILSVEPDRAKMGDTLDVQLTAYNTQFTEADSIRVWLKLTDHYSIRASNIEVFDQRRLRCDFIVPPAVPEAVESEVYPLTMIVDNPMDGPFVLPNAVFLKPGSDRDNSEVSGSDWNVDDINHLNTGWEFAFPYRNILAETIRNTYFHVPMWFAMIAMFIISVYSGIRYLRSGGTEHAHRMVSLNRVGMVFGLLGITTGAVWAKYTWGAFWSGDVKQNMTAVALLIYAAFFVLRTALEDPQQRNRVSAAYNLFAFAALIPLLFVFPRMQDSLHPGSGGNPAMGGEDLDHTMRLVFYPAVIGWILFGYWMAKVDWRLTGLKEKYVELSHSDGE